MKNYLISVVKLNEKINASLHCKETTSADQQMVLDLVVQSLPKLERVSSLEDGNTYCLEADNIADIEPMMRAIGFRKCDSCGAWICPQDIRDEQYQGGGIRYCDICLANQPKKLKVYGYHDTSDQLKFYKLDHEEMTDATFKGWGIEMECDASNVRMINTNGFIKCTDAFYTESRSRKKMWRLERDGSLREAIGGGVEFISNCMSTEYLKSYDFRVLTGQMQLLGADDTCSTSGFHLHASKLHFGDDKQTQAMNALKLYYVMAIYQNDFLKLSGRKSDQMGYCRFIDKSRIDTYKENIKTYCSENNPESPWFNPFSRLPSGHDTCIITSGATIEVRIFKSTSDPVRLKHTLNLMVGIIENIKNVSWEKIYVMKKLFNKVEPETMRYWRSQGCFLNTYASTQKGETY